jgi:hypothetical protein
MTEDEGSDGSSLGRKGFEIFRANRVRRLGPTVFLVSTETGVDSFIVELRDGNWVCDCDQKLEECQHRYAVRLAAISRRVQEPSDNVDDTKLVCRYCGSPDISRCGFRYNAYGISRRLRCNECLRKFSVKYTDSTDTTPYETTWLLSEIGLVLTKLEELTERVASGGLGYVQRA